MNLKKWIASCYANKNERNCKRLRGFKTYEEKILLTFDCVRTVVACKSSRSRASIGSIKLRAWLQKMLTACTKSLSCMGFDGLQVDVWNLFTITMQTRQKLRDTWTTKQSCQRSIILEEKSRTCWMSSITLWAKRLFFVLNSFQAAWNIPIVFTFGKQNSLSKIFLLKRWHFWTCFYITKGDESKIPW